MSNVETKKKNETLRIMEGYSRQHCIQVLEAVLKNLSNFIAEIELTEQVPVE